MVLFDATRPAQMNVREVDARRYTRVQLPIQAEVSYVSPTFNHKPAHLRDISAGGAFLYTQLSPEVGAVLHLRFTVSGIASDLQVSCEGRVLRVLPAQLGELNGIAVAFDRLNLGSW
ncbi:MAG: hypothetical protein DMG61_15675 [Acidobacteria bacterium]|nr:MAG: hypothetical protein DMG61_15675 [Acidobacteriota bacterium]PYY18404.1 MAG: hypothetical protein DMG60_08490 [Acidobacteriota bacterium]